MRNLQNFDTLIKVCYNYIIMEETSVNPIKYVVILALLGMIVLALFLLPLAPTKAQNKGSFSAALAGGTLCSAGLGCDSYQSQSTASPKDSNESQAPGLFPFSGLFGGSGNESLAGDPVISIVNVEGQNSVFRITNGLKHSIPTTEIFYSYGFNLKMVQKITTQELNKYPDARLFMVKGNEEEKDQVIYYLTDGGILRPMLNDKVFYSYGNRKEDVITINRKEFNYYPRNQFVFVERPQINREIYQITGGIKRYLTPVAVKRMNLREEEIAPINQIEFDEYPMGEPVIF